MFVPDIGWQLSRSVVLKNYKKYRRFLGWFQGWSLCFLCYVDTKAKPKNDILGGTLALVICCYWVDLNISIFLEISKLKG